MRKALALGTAVSALALGLTGTSASASSALVSLAVGLDTPTLSIAAPTAVVVASSPAVATIATTVTDTRLSNGVGWTATISSQNLTLTGATSPGTTETIQASTMTAYTGDVNSTVPGTASITGEYLPGAPLALTNSLQTFVTAANRTNANTAVYTATVTIPTAGKTAGVYTGNVTQSAS
ncbi:MAG: hypothetical protein H7233_09755 [Pseudorhodobacter sp.]|nr:hypothetical protein [Frankiaceae bacterium]